MKNENCSFFSAFLYYSSGAAPGTNLKKQFVTMYNCYAAYQNQTIHYVGLQKQKNQSKIFFHFNLCKKISFLTSFKLEINCLSLETNEDINTCPCPIAFDHSFHQGWTVLFIQGSGLDIKKSSTSIFFHLFLCHFLNVLLIYRVRITFQH